jgi:hypothetical protein
MATDNPEAQQKQFVILRRYRDLPEAVVVKSILDFDGIECFLTDENLIRMDWFWSGLLGGVKLWVRQQDVNEAQNLIDQRPPEGFDVEGVGEFQQPHCPKCQSVDISFKELNKLWPSLVHILAYLYHSSVEAGSVIHVDTHGDSLTTQSNITQRRSW